MKTSAKIWTIAALLTSTAAFAAVTEGDAAKLGKELTPVGAERAANKDGSIPAWSGDAAKAPVGWKKGAAPTDPYGGQKPLYTIDASNVDKYKDKLNPGQAELVKLHKGYRINVYASQRSCPVPAAMADSTRKNATTAKLTSNGWGLAEAVGGGIPFPIPKNGAEVIWNFKLRPQGELLTATLTSTLPPKGATGKNLGEVQFFDDKLMFPMGAPGRQIADANGVEFYYMDFIVAPAGIAGEGVLAHYYFDKPNDIWLYFASQRRVRRAPTYQYDAPVTQTDNLLAVDQVWMFNGPLDRYDLKLVGKRELIIPYNNTPIYDHTAKPESIHDPLFMVRDKVRYELHRVWVVEATVKQGVRHSFPKRTFYVDEDSWLVAAEDLYDAQGKVWRTMEAYTVPDWTLGACVQAGYVSYDLQVGRYISDKIIAGSGKAPEYASGKDMKMDATDFNLESFRQKTGR